MAAQRIADSVALVTGANRGIGRAIVEALLRDGARKVYAGVRDQASLAIEGAIPVEIDITDDGEVARAVESCPDVTLLVNNAGILRITPFLAASAVADAREQMATNYFGTLAMSRAFAPVLGANGGGTLVNILSVVSWFTHPANGTYGATKAAERSLTDGLRQELRSQGTQVTGVYCSFVNTDMIAGLDVPKVAPEIIANAVLAGVEAGENEVLADSRSGQIKELLAQDQDAFYASLGQ